MEPEIRDIYFGDRLSTFQAAAVCLSIAPMLRQAGRYCIFAGGVTLGILLLKHTAIASPFLWISLALFSFGIYLHLPEPQPLALPVAAIIILAVVADSIYFDYEQWRLLHTAPKGVGIGLIVEVLFSLSLFKSYFSYKKNLSATDVNSMDELREVARAMNKADLSQKIEIVELAQKNNRLRLRKMDRFILLTERHYIAFGIYSKLDAVAVQIPTAVFLEAAGNSRPGKPLKLRFSFPPLKLVKVKLKPEYLPRISRLGIAIKGISAEAEQGDNGIPQRRTQIGNV